MNSSASSDMEPLDLSMRKITRDMNMVSYSSNADRRCEERTTENLLKSRQEKVRTENYRRMFSNEDVKAMDLSHNFEEQDAGCSSKHYSNYHEDDKILLKIPNAHCNNENAILQMETNSRRTSSSQSVVSAGLPTGSDVTGFRKCVFDCKGNKPQVQFSQRVTEHQRIPTGERLFPCKVCGNLFTTKYYLSQHQKTHTGERYVCTTCGKELKRFDSLQNHSRMHTGEKPFVCNKCPKAYASKSSLINHRKKHNGEFQCPDCLKIFSYKCGLVRHHKNAY
ncbi:hypothetical protein NPIL_104081 [Nephila pilipes]|uniref:C2H2-type domain-containing protein n=1 Tax=Nephila pilipes TaxID=299642 RepID=A0A8X6NP10_NEPPI|nr:hypothetical protein NPIL_104081 [Nephila pilipes]